MAWRRGQTYSQDLRDRVLAAAALTARQAAERFGVSVSYVVKARQRLVRTGAPTPRPQKPPAARKLLPFHGALQERVARLPDATLAEHREWLAEAHGVVAGVTTVWKTLKRLNLTRKKKSLRAAEQSRPDVAEARRQWITRQPDLDVRRLVFLDETWAKTNMTRLYGRSLRGTRLVGSAPHGHWKTTTFLAGLRHDGIVAPLMLDGPINGEAFLAWTEQFLAPELRPGDIVVADRLGSHKGVAARQAIEARGAELMLLPSYSHDLNPIEQVFAKLKALLRKAAPRTREALWRTIGEKLSMFTPAECQNYLRHCGYGHPA